MIDEIVNITIIGAGVIGLAIARELSERHKNLVILEKNDSYGQETSSRGGEIVHSGLYFPSGFFKGDFCRPGNRALFEICTRHNIPHKQMGKLIVARGDDQIEGLEKIKANGEENGVDDLKLVTKRQIHSLEPEVSAEAGLFSPSTGIIDSHKLMYYFLKTAESNCAVVAYRSKVTDIQYDGEKYTVEVNHGEYRFRTNLLVNCAGLYAHQIAGFVGIDIETRDYRIYYSKGSFFSASPSPKLSHLVWPIRSQKDRQNSGKPIHAQLDLGGSVHFGPFWENVDAIEYTVCETKKDIFYESIRTYLPEVTKDSLRPAMSGIRPCLQGPHDPYRDFVIKDEADSGYNGFINLIGIECPGLTDAIPIARYVASLIDAYE